jgi:hypothetical protein
MSIDEARDLRERLDRDFQAITPRRAPVESTIRQGKAIRMRRRVTAALGAAVVAATGVAVPALLHQHARQEAAAKVVTVYPPGPHSPAALIASGTVGRLHWQVSADKLRADGAGPGKQCFVILGVPSCAPIVKPSQSAPVAFIESSALSMDIQYGAVDADVAYVTVSLADGTVLTLHPVARYGSRYVAFAAPAGAAISSATAYSQQGQIATAIPVNLNGSPSFLGWLRPGQRGLPRSTRLIGSGKAGGRAWSATAYVGPWGRCILVSDGSGSCAGITSSLETLDTAIWKSSTGPPEVVYGTASASVDHVIITLPDGKTVQARAVVVVGQKFFAVAVGQVTNGFRWAAYDTSGHEVGSGRETGT